MYHILIRIIVQKCLQTYSCLEVEQCDGDFGINGGGRPEEEEEHRGEHGDQRNQPHDEARGGRDHVVRLGPLLPCDGDDHDAH